MYIMYRAVSAATSELNYNNYNNENTFGLAVHAHGSSQAP